MYRLPTFNITIGIYRGDNPPPGIPVATTIAQLRYYNRLCVPATVDLRDSYSSAAPDIVEIPLGSGRYYTILITDFVAMGFTNQYRFAYVQKNTGFPAPDPYPPG